MRKSAGKLGYLLRSVVGPHAARTLLGAPEGVQAFVSLRLSAAVSNNGTTTPRFRGTLDHWKCGLDREKIPC
jgi:hypothetical protein